MILQEIAVSELKTTPVTFWHKAHGGRMTAFAGWQMPLHFSAGILQEHLTVRRYGGMFDVSHMGRFRVTGPGAVTFLQRVLSSDVAALAPWRAQYTILPREDGSALDDAYLFRFGEEYWLVVNAANTEADWVHLVEESKKFSVTLNNLTADTAMFAVQGPQSESLLQRLLTGGRLPEAGRNALSEADLDGISVKISRTGYTGEPIGFEVFLAAENAASLWQRLIEAGEPLGITAIGLGARDTLRLEAGLTLFGHELGTDPDGRPIPVLAAPSAAVAVSLAADKGEFVGRQAIQWQMEIYQKYRTGEAGPNSVLPRIVRPLAILDPGVARQGDEVYWQGKKVGTVTSGTMVPYWVFDREDELGIPTDVTGRRAIALALIDLDVPKNAAVEVLVRGKHLQAQIVPRHGRADRPPYFRPQVVTHTSVL